MYLIYSLTALGVASSIIWFVYRLAKAQADKEPVMWKKFVVVVGNGTGALIAIGAILYLWRPITMYSVVWLPWLNQQIHPLFAALIIIFLVIVLLSGFRYMIYQSMTNVKMSAKILKAIDIVSIVLGIFTGIKIIGLAAPTNAWWMTWHLYFTAIVVWAIYRYFNNWHAQNKHKSGLVVMFCLNCAATLYYSAALGFNGLANVVGSVYSLVGVALFLGYLGWFNFGIGDPEKPLKKRVAYLPLLIWSFCAFLAGSELLYYQFTNQLSWHELESFRIVNYDEKLWEDMHREEKAKYLDTIDRLYRCAVKAKNFESAQHWKIQLRETRNAQAQIKRAPREVPEAIDGSLFYPPNLKTTISNLWPFGSKYPEIIETKLYSLTKYSEKYWIYTFKTNNPVELFQWNKGASITFSGFKPTEQIWFCYPDGQILEMIENGTNYGKEWSTPCLIKYKKGGTLIINWS